MAPSTRRALLRGSGLALGGLLTGCTGDGPVGSASPTGTPPAETTEQFPPPEPTSAAPRDPASMPTATDWTRFRADAGNTGHVSGVTAVPGAPEVYWQFFVRSSTPVVADGALYTSEYGRGRSLVARDAATGRVRWTTRVDEGGSLGVPTVAGERVVVQSYALLFAFDRRTGELRWERDVGRGPPGSPVVVDGVAYLANGASPTGPRRRSRSTSRPATCAGGPTSGRASSVSGVPSPSATARCSSSTATSSRSTPPTGARPGEPRSPRPPRRRRPSLTGPRT